MNPHTFLPSLAARGMAVTLDGEKIIIRPAALLTDTDRDFIRTNKAAIVAALAIPAQSDPPAEKTTAARGANSLEISDFDTTPTLADAERAAVGDVRPTTRPGGLIDALASDGLLHPRGIVTATADGRRVWQHPDFDGDECAKAMRDPEAMPSMKWNAESGRFVTPNRDTDRAGEKGGAE